MTPGEGQDAEEERGERRDDREVGPAHAAVHEERHRDRREVPAREGEDGRADRKADGLARHAAGRERCARAPLAPHEPSHEREGGDREQPVEGDALPACEGDGERREQEREHRHRHAEARAHHDDGALHARAADISRISAR